MTAQAVAYLLLGIVLVAALAGLTLYFYGRQRRDKIERAKYRMLDDDE